MSKNMKQKKNQDAGWTERESVYYRETRPDGRLRVHGIYFCLGNLAKYSLNEQEDGSMRGRVSLISRDGHIMQRTGKERREGIKRIRERQGKEAVLGEHMEELTVMRSVTVKSTDEMAVKNAIAKAAIELCAQHSHAIEKNAGDMQTDKLRPARAVRLHCGEFLLAIAAHNSQKEKRRKELALSRLAAKLDNCTMDEVPQKILETIYAEEVDAAIRDYRLAEKFWTYCAETGKYQGENPFTTFLENHQGRKRKNPELQQKTLEKDEALSWVIEKALNEEIHKARSNNYKMTGLLLVKEACLTSHEAAELTWKDIIFDDIQNPWGSEGSTTARIRMEKEQIAGATHDYTKPVTPFGAVELKRRFDNLKKRYGDEVYKKRLLGEGRARVSAKELTAFCRETLHRAGTTYQQLADARAQNSGAGIRLLLSNYEQRLLQFGGMDPEGEVSFLTGRSLRHDTTSNHYRCFTSPDGQAYLQNILQRDNRIKQIYNSQVSRTVVDGEKQVAISSRDNQHFNEVRCTVVLKPGEHLQCVSPYGLTEVLKEVKEVKRMPKQAE